MKLAHIAGLSVLTVASAAGLYALRGESPPAQPSPEPTRGASLTYFEPNMGQFADAGIRFVARVGEGSVVLRDDGVAFANREGVVATMSVEGSRPVSPAPGQKLLGVVNYMVGPQDTWRTGIPTYGAVRYEDVKPGVDLLIYRQGPKVEYDLVVDAGVDARSVRLTFDGARRVVVSAAGELSIHTERGTLRQQRPVVVHRDGTREPVAFAQTELPNTVAFALPRYEPGEAIVIDPVIAYSSFLGGASGGGATNDIATDASGNYAVVGSTTSASFPVMSAFQGTAPGGTSAFVTKFDSTNAVLFSTYLGGTDDDIAHAVAMAGDGTVWVAGETMSVDFPTTRCGLGGSCPACNTQVAAAYNFCGIDDFDVNEYCDPISLAECNVGTAVDGFFTVLTSDGSALSYSTFLGGIADDRVYDITIAGGVAHLVGETSSASAQRFPATGLDTTLDGATDGFYITIDPTTGYPAGLTYGTYIGGDGADSVAGVAVDSGGDVFMTGQTASTDFPVTDASSPQGTDAFLVDFNGTAIEFATHIGGAGTDEGRAVAVNAADDVFVVGQGDATTFAPTASALGTGGGSDGFIVRYNTATPANTYSALLGTTGTDSISGVAAPGGGQAIIGGTRDPAGAGFPFNSAITQTVGDGFVARVNATGTGTTYNTPVGGAGTGGADTVSGVGTDASGNIYVAGNTNNPSDFPLVGTPFDAANDTASDEGFVMRLNPNDADVQVAIADSPDPVTLGNTLTYTVTVTNNGPTTVVDVPVAISTANGGVTLMGWDATSGGATCNVVTETAQCTIASLTNAASVDITVTMTPMNAAGTITLSADLDDGGYGIYWTDTTPANNTASEDTTAQAPVAMADIGIAMADAPDPVTLGNNVTYTIDVTNNGPDAATGVEVTVTLDANVNFVSASAGCTGTGPVVCTVGGLANSATSQITIDVTPTTAGMVTSSAAVVSTSMDGVAGNDTAMATTAVNAPPMGADMGVQIVAAPMPAITGNILTYTVTVTNNGPENATGAGVSVDLDANSTFETATPSQGTCSGTDPVTCDLGLINASSMATITIEVTPDMMGMVTATATVGADPMDANATNDTDPVTVTVDDPLLPQADLDVDIVEMTDPIVLGDTANYTFTITNDGPEVATGLTFTGTVTGVLGTITITPATGSCTGTNTFSCSFGDFADGQSTTVDVSVVTATSGLLTVNGSATSAAEEDPRPSRATAGENTTVLASIAPTVAVSSGPGASPSSANGGQLDVPLLTARLAAGGLEDTNVNQMTFTVTGSGNDPVDVAALKVYADLNNNGRIELETMTPDLLLGSAVFDANDGTAVVGLTGAMPIVAQMSGTFIVAADFAGEPPAMGGMSFIPSTGPGTWLAPLFAALALLLGGLAVATRRRVRVRVRVWAGSFALGMALAAAGCSGGGGTQQQVVRGDRTFTLRLTDVQATGAMTTTAATVSGLPLQGRPVEVSFGDGI